MLLPRLNLLPFVSRRKALQLLSGGIVSSLAIACQTKDPQASFRFAVASDGHLGEPNTPSDQYFTDLLMALKSLHQNAPIQFVVINGDLVHQTSTDLLPKAKAYLDQLPIPYYVTRGNHDRVSLNQWESVWGYATNHIVERQEATLVLLDTSNEAGDYLCGDSQWLNTTLKNTRSDRPIFLFMHIPYFRNTSGTDVCTDILTVLNKYPNVRAIFHGHDHTKDIGLTLGQTILFDGHFGSSWGTAYRGYRVVEGHPSNSYFTYQYDYVNQRRINELVF